MIQLEDFSILAEQNTNSCEKYQLAPNFVLFGQMVIKYFSLLLKCYHLIYFNQLLKDLFKNMIPKLSNSLF